MTNWTIQLKIDTFPKQKSSCWYYIIAVTFSNPHRRPTTPRFTHSIRIQIGPNLRTGPNLHTGPNMHTGPNHICLLLNLTIQFWIDTLSLEESKARQSVGDCSHHQQSQNNRHQPAQDDHPQWSAWRQPRNNFGPGLKKKTILGNLDTSWFFSLTWNYITVALP